MVKEGKKVSCPTLTAGQVRYTSPHLASNTTDDIKMYKNTMVSFHRIAERNPELLKYYKAPVCN